MAYVKCNTVLFFYQSPQTNTLFSEVHAISVQSTYTTGHGFARYDDIAIHHMKQSIIIDIFFVLKYVCLHYNPFSLGLFCSYPLPVQRLSFYLETSFLQT